METLNLCGFEDLSPLGATTSIPQTNNKKDNTSYIHSSQQFYGNRCGHSRLNPRSFIPPKHHKRRFPVLERAKDYLKQLYFLPFIDKFSTLLFHPKRKKRSERRESILYKVGQALMHFVNLKELVLGFINTTGKLITYSIGFIAKVCKISYQSAYRAIRAFEKAGYVRIDQRREIAADGSIRSLNPIIRVNPKLFWDLVPEEYASYLNDQQLKIDRVEQKKRRQELQQKGKAYAHAKRQERKEEKKNQPAYEEHQEVPQEKRPYTEPEKARTFIASIMANLRGTSKPPPD